MVKPTFLLALTRGSMRYKVDQPHSLLALGALGLIRLCFALL